MRTNFTFVLLRNINSKQILLACCSKRDTYIAASGGISIIKSHLPLTYNKTQNFQKIRELETIS